MRDEAVAIGFHYAKLKINCFVRIKKHKLNAFIPDGSKGEWKCAETDTRKQPVNTTRK
jgi:hypothetical protein